MAERFVIEDAPKATERFVIEGETKTPMPPAPKIPRFGSGQIDYSRADPHDPTVRAQIKENQAFLDPLARMAIATPLAMAGGTAGAAVGVPAFLGRALTMGGLRGGESLAKGKALPEATWDALVDIALSVGTEGTLSLVKTLGLDRLGRAARGFDFLKDAPQKALDYVLPRIQHVKRVLIPSIDPAKKLTWQEAIDRLGDLRGQEWKIAREEIKSQMNAFDKQAVKPAAGTVFKSMAKTRRDTPLLDPSRFSRIAQEIGEASATPGVRATADVLATEDVGGVPAGAVGGLALKDEFGRLARSAIRHFVP
jgi:hypothetical protein